MSLYFKVISEKHLGGESKTVVEKVRWTCDDLAITIHIESEDITMNWRFGDRTALNFFVALGTRAAALLERKDRNGDP